jgi:hypothetical protein
MLSLWLWKCKVGNDQLPKAVLEERAKWNPSHALFKWVRRMDGM